MKNKLLLRLFGLAILGIFVIYNLPPVRERVGWRVAEILADVKYAISPPEEVIFVPKQEMRLPTQTTPAISLDLTQTTSTVVMLPTSTQPPLGDAPIQMPTPIPQKINLTSFQHEYQTWNNCGPATLGMALSFWGWKGNQQPVAAFTKPNARDKNVMPYELTAFVEEETGFQAITRAGGDLDLLKRFLASGMPVMIEKGFVLPKDGWMGHYVLVTGYDDSRERFTVQDSYLGPNQVVTYDDLQSYWRAFNFTYLIVYPSERADEIETILGPDIDEKYAFRSAAQTASNELYLLSGRDQFFAWFNRGTSFVKLQDYAGAAEAYDQAFALYPIIPEKDRPWRMMWYQTGPYWAYYYTGRYQDVIDLATKTLDAMSEPVLEESYYWRALARQALGDKKGALKDLRSSLEYHPGFEPVLTQLDLLKGTP